MSDPSRKKSQNPWRAVALATAIGADLVVCMVAGYFAGLGLKNWFGGHPGWLVIGIMAGFLAGVAGLIFILRYYLEDRNG